jgi:hypothetical protein
VFILLALFGIAGWGQTTGPRQFEVALPDNWPQGQSISVVFKDLEVPENRPVVFRLFAVEKDQERPIGEVSLLGKSADAIGTRHLDRLEANITQRFRRWAETAKPRENITLCVRPFAGLKEAPDYRWNVGEVSLEVR